MSGHSHQCLDVTFRPEVLSPGQSLKERPINTPSILAPRAVAGLVVMLFVLWAPPSGHCRCLTWSSVQLWHSAIVRCGSIVFHNVASVVLLGRGRAGLAPWADMADGISLFVLKPPTTGLLCMGPHAELQCAWTRVIVTLRDELYGCTAEKLYGCTARSCTAVRKCAARGDRRTSSSGG